MDPITFKVEGIKKFHLSNLGGKKADGPDNIPERIIKEVVSDIAEVICFLVYQSYISSELPLDWCKEYCTYFQERL